MKYVYILKSLSCPGKHYTGIADNVQARLDEHNAGGVASSKPYMPWQIETIVGFEDINKAAAFEQYLKSGSGRAFAKKHF